MAIGVGVGLIHPEAGDSFINEESLQSNGMTKYGYGDLVDGAFAGSYTVRSVTNQTDFQTYIQQSNSVLVFHNCTDGNFDFGTWTTPTDVVNVTIAGHTHPSGGIRIAGKTHKLQTCENFEYYNVTFVGPTAAVYPNQTLDVVQLTSCDRIYFRNCDFGWGNDECLTLESSTNVSFDYCVFYETLIRGGHSEGDIHSYGPLVRVNSANASFFRCAFALNARRQPQFAADLVSRHLVSQCLMYHWRAGSSTYNSVGRVDFLDNIYLVSNEEWAPRGNPIDIESTTETEPIFYLSGNSAEGGAGYPYSTQADLVEVGGDPTADPTDYLASTRFTNMVLPSVPADLEADILTYAGSMPRYAEVNRIMQEIADRRGIIGFPQRDNTNSPATPVDKPTAGAGLADTDADGIPDSYEGTYATLQEYLVGLHDDLVSAAGTWTPSDLSGTVVLGLTPEAGVTVSTGVSAWTSQWGGTVNCSQATGTKQPALNSGDAFSGTLDLVQGDGTDDYLALSGSITINCNAGWMLTWVGTYPGTGNQVFILGKDASNYIQLSTAQAIVVRLNGTSTSVANGVDVVAATEDGYPSIYQITCDASGNLKAYVNGTDVTNGSPNRVDNNTVNTFMARGAAVGFSTAKFGPTLFVSGPPTAHDRESLRHFLGKWTYFDPEYDMTSLVFAATPHTMTALPATKQSSNWGAEYGTTRYAAQATAGKQPNISALWKKGFMGAAGIAGDGGNDHLDFDATINLVNTVGWLMTVVIRHQTLAGDKGIVGSSASDRIYVSQTGTEIRGVINGGAVTTWASGFDDSSNDSSVAGQYDPRCYQIGCTSAGNIYVYRDGVLVTDVSAPAGDTNTIPLDYLLAWASATGVSDMVIGCCFIQTADISAAERKRIYRWVRSRFLLLEGN